MNNVFAGLASSKRGMFVSYLVLFLYVFTIITVSFHSISVRSIAWIVLLTTAIYGHAILFSSYKKGCKIAGISTVVVILLSILSLSILVLSGLSTSREDIEFAHSLTLAIPGSIYLTFMWSFIYQNIIPKSGSYLAMGILLFVFMFIAFIPIMLFAFLMFNGNYIH